MIIKNATMEDFDIVFDYIQMLWTYNTYDRETIQKVYREVLENDDDFMFLIFAGEKSMGFCHGTFFNTFWLSGQTCYVSSIFTVPEARGKGYGRKLMDHAQKLARERGCAAIVLDSGIPRKEAHRFYELYGFDKCAHCYQLKLS